MLNNDLKIEKKEITEFKVIPKNIYQVELLDIKAEERPTYDTRNKEDSEKIYETVLNFQFVLLAGKDGDDNLRGRNVWANFVPTSLYISNKNGKNMLYKIVEGLIGRELTQEEEANGLTGEKLNSLIGRQCRLSVEVNEKDGKSFNKVKDCFAKETDYAKLTDDEKENATVKEKDNEDKNFNVPTATSTVDDYIQAIPF